MGGIVDWLLDFIYDLASLVLGVLPESPFQNPEFIKGLDSFGNLMSNINYFIPFGTMFLIMTGYITCVLIWYGVRWVLRIANYID